MIDIILDNLIPMLINAKVMEKLVFAKTAGRKY